MKNGKIIVCIIVAVCILTIGIIAFALNTEQIKNSTSTHDVGNNSSVNSTANQVNNSSNTNTSENSVKSMGGSSNSETHEGVSKEQAKQRASEEIKGMDYIELRDPVWRSQYKMWDVPLFNKNNNKDYGNVYIYVENGKITKVVPYF
ncbi:MAG: hypothetical protein LBR15_01665 [Methanobrevibacter sp.]|jgi:hypothetical protein|nr:hypothetical protein [Candidatus Methanovirga australis]